MTLVPKRKSSPGSRRKLVSLSGMAMRARVVVAVHKIQEEQQHGSPKIHGV
jgi:hypothetical protein